MLEAFTMAKLISAEITIKLSRAVKDNSPADGTFDISEVINLSQLEEVVESLAEDKSVIIDVKV